MKNKNTKFTKQDLIDLLIKKATGFYYSEEQLEYERSQKLGAKAKNDAKYSQGEQSILGKDLQNGINGLDGARYGQVNGVKSGLVDGGKCGKNAKILENQLSIFEDDFAFQEKNAIREESCAAGIEKIAENEPENCLKLKKTAIRAKSKSKSLASPDTVCTKKESLDDNMGLSNDVQNDDSSLVITKKKVTTHFVAPDMIAIKILFEIFEKKVDEDDLEKITDDELINLKKKLLEELKNDDD